MALAFPLTFRNVFDDALLLLGFEDGNHSPMYIRERVINDINAALQFIQTAPDGSDYFTREAETVSTGSGTASYALDQDIQNVFAPVRLGDGTLLRQFTRRGEFDLFANVCLGTATAANGQPLCYFLQRFREDDADNCAMTLFLAPTPDATYTLHLEVAREAANFTYDDLTDEAKVIPIAHAYAQSLFLPIVRHNLLTSHLLMVRPEIVPDIKADYLRALRQLGRDDPQTAAAGKAEIKEEAAA